MPATTDDFYDWCDNMFGPGNMDQEQKDELLDAAQQNEDIFTAIKEDDPESLLDLLDDLPMDDDEEMDVDDEPDDVVIPDSDAMDDDRGMYMASAKIGSKYIVEFENDNVYIPRSNFCSINALNKFLELQGRGKNILSTKGVSAFKLSYKKLINKMMMTCFPCDCAVIKNEKQCNNECIKKKINLYKTDDNYFNNKNLYPATSCDKYRPAVYKVHVKDGQLSIKKYTSLEDKNTKLAIGIFYIDNCDKAWHAFVIKDKSKFCVDDMKIRLSSTQPLNPVVSKLRKYVQKKPKQYVLVWDCETYIDVEQTKKGKTFKLFVYGVRGQISNLKTRENIGPAIVTTFKTTEKINIHNVMERFFEDVSKVCINNNIKEINAYAYNSSRFDSIFCTNLDNVKYGKMIKTGNTIKSGSITVNNVDIKLLDLLPFCLSSLDQACKTFKTEVKKQSFDIVNKTKYWYTINLTKSGYDEAMNLEKNIDVLLNTPKKSCCKHDKLMDNIVVYRYVVEEVRNQIVINDKKCRRCAIVDAVNDIRSGYKDWMTYLKYDVDSLQSLLYKVEDMYIDMGASITNFVGLPGVAWDLMHSYCYNLALCFVPKDPTYIQLCRDMYYGGRTIFFHTHWDSKLNPGIRYDESSRRYLNDKNEVVKENIYDDYLICLDANGLYPSMQCLCGFPVGEPILITPDIDWKNKKHYIVKVDIKIPNIRYAIHPVRQGGALVYPSNQTITGTYNDVDLREMMIDGYEVVKFHHGVWFKSSKKIFANYVEYLFNKRNHFKSLHPDDPEQPKEYLYKILQNAGYGKFSETIKSETLFFDKKGLLKYVKNIFKGKDKHLYDCCKNAEKTLEFNPVLLCKKAKVNMVPKRNGQYMVTRTLDHPRVTKPTYIAGYITAYARKMMNELIRKVGPENVYAGDTDSLYMKRSVMDKANFKFTNDLGGFKNDYGEGNLITRARFLDIKRAYLEFSREVKPKFLDKFGKVHPACIDPITDEVNEGESYFARTFKFKFTGLNFRDVKFTSNALQPEDRALSLSVYKDDNGKKSLQVYNKLMLNMRNLAEEFLKRSVKDEKDIKEPIRFMITRLCKLNLSIKLDNKELGFAIAPHKRGQWTNGEYYSLGFDRNEEEKYIVTGDFIGDMKRSFEHLKKVSYGFSTNGYLRSNRPIIFPSYFKYEYLCKAYKNAGVRIKYNSDHELVKQFNEADDQCEIIMKVGKEITDMVKALNMKKPFDKERFAYLSELNKYFNHSLKNNKDINTINILNMADVIIDRRVDCKYPLPEVQTKIKSYEKKVLDTDYYIYIEGKIPNFIDYNNGYKVYYKQKDFKGKNTYYEPHFINVKQTPIELDETNLYPVIMFSDKFNFGNNHMDLNQTKKLYYAVDRLMNK
jgi:hypothetical protein